MDVKTLVLVIHRLRNRFNIEKICIVSDRVMISAETMNRLPADIIFILGVRMGRLLR